MRYRQIVSLFFTIFLATLCLSCSKSVPGCSDKDTIELVLQIVKKNSNQNIDLMLVQQGGGKFKLDSIRTTEVNKQTGACSCAANIIVSDKLFKDFQLPVIYTTEITDKGELYVTVLGL